MELSKLTLVNWFVFSPEDIPIKGSVAVTGHNGAGKSTIMDAIQTVFFGANKNDVQFNKSASTKSGERDLRGYCLGLINPAESEAEKQAFQKRRNDTLTYLALTFTNPANSIYPYSTLIVALEARDSERDISVRGRLTYRGTHEVSKHDFSTLNDDGGYRTTAWNVFKASAMEWEGELNFAKNSGEFKRNRDIVLSGQNIRNRIATEQLDRVLKRSIGLKEVGDLSGFVKNFILENEPVDISSLQNSIQNHKSIQGQIDLAVRKIEQINEALSNYDRAKKRLKKSINFAWCSAEEAVNAEYNALSIKEGDLIKAKGKLQENVGNLKANKGLLIEAEDQLRDVTASIMADSSENQKMLIKGRINSLSKEIKAKENPVSIFHENLSSVISNAVKSELPNSEQSKVLHYFKRMTEESVAFWPEQASTIRANMEKAYNFLGGLATSAEERHFECKTEHKLLEKRSEELKEKILSAEDGRKELRPETQSLISALDAVGIEATPVCNLIDVLDPEWQAAIEAFMKGNLEALIVHPEDEIRALKVQRGLSRTGRIIRTSRYEKWLQLNVQENSVVHFIDSENIYAKAFIHKIFAHIVAVDSELELTEKNYAMTKDGMATSSITHQKNRLPQTLMLGKDYSHNIQVWKGELSELIPKISEKHKDVTFYEKNKNAFVKLHSLVERFIKESLDESLSAIPLLSSQLEVEQKAHDAIYTSHIADLEEKRRILSGNVEGYKSKHDEYNQAAGGLNANIGTLERAILYYNNELIPTVEIQRQEIEADELYDAEICDAIQMEYEVVEGKVELFTERKQKLQEQAENSLREANHLTKVYSEEFGSPLKFEGHGSAISVDAEEAVTWLTKQQQNLEESELAKYQQEAEKAKAATEDILRADYISKMREKFRNLKAYFNELNSNLRERVFHNTLYTFKRFPKNEYKELIRYIERSNELDSANTGSLFDDGVPHELQVILEQLQNPNFDGFDEIKDYRGYFYYDVEIKDLSTGATFSLNKKLGTSSGGETQTPFYVAISTSLATAWKLEGKESDGAGICMFDEAFSNMDDANLSESLMFMNTMGLQPIILAPDGKAAQFKASMDTSVEIIREGTQAWVFSTALKDDGRDLYQKENPHLNKRLLEQELERVESDASV
ncbi:MAG: SbcC/MukB-like Walker B domain-containing protein [Bacteroidales bacterium]|jgi:DNA repair exonuclease SbcCD ATPase subunit|nr:SbcC/MukB-like Walker B domain-containing protein [Bacteroidales bacterium]